MKLKDLILLIVVVAVLLPFFLYDSLYQGYVSLNGQHPYILAFIKFAILSTLGEAMGLRVRTGNYTQENYGFMPRAILWGLFGIWIALAIKAFGAGTPAIGVSLGLKDVPAAMAGTFSGTKLFVAFMTSVMINTAFAPVFMTLHKMTDAHIIRNGGKLSALTTPMDMVYYFKDINWDVQWNFVFKKTVPFFWIPAHTITFMLPGELQVLFSAALSIALGVILSAAAVMSRKKA